MEREKSYNETNFRMQETQNFQNKEQQLGPMEIINVMFPKKTFEVEVGNEKIEYFTHFSRESGYFRFLLPLCFYDLDYENKSTLWATDKPEYDARKFAYDLPAEWFKNAKPGNTLGWHGMHMGVALTYDGNLVAFDPPNINKNESYLDKNFKIIKTPITQEWMVLWGEDKCKTIDVKPARRWGIIKKENSYPNYKIALEHEMKEKGSIAVIRDIHEKANKLLKNGLLPSHLSDTLKYQSFYDSNGELNQLEINNISHEINEIYFKHFNKEKDGGL